MNQARISTLTNIVNRKVRLIGLSDIMFDRYPGGNNTKLEPHQKLYLENSVIGIPSLNIMSFLSAHNTNSAPKRLRDKRKYKDIANAMNRYYQHLTPRQQYDYYFNSIRAMRRVYNKWGKKKDDDKINLIMSYHNYSYLRAVEVIDLFTEDQLVAMKKEMEVGG